MAELEPTLTLPDIATLAGVQRAVVSMWRRRPRVRGQLMPFPDPVPPAGPVERFRRDEIVEWLARTGRGNNTEHRLDAPALSAPPGAALEDLVTLLCLYMHSDADSELADLTSGEREHLARRIDPADSFLLTEVRHLPVTDEALRFVDDLVGASLGLADALSRLEHGAAGRALGRRDLTAPALALVGAITRALAMYLDADGVPVTFAGGPPGLALAVASTGRGLMIEGNGPAERALRRRAAIHGLDIMEANGGPRVYVRSVLGFATDATLTRIDDQVLDLGPREVALVLGPAAAVCDRLRGDDERNRATTLRMRRLVAAIRLPRGMWREAHRQALGLWICAGDQTIDRPMIADLGAFPPAELSVEDLADDVAGALSAKGDRGFRYLRFADLPAILTGAPLVPMGARAPRWETPSRKHLDQVQAAALVTAEPLAPYDILVTAAPGAVLLRRRSLQELHEAGVLVMRRGRRIDPHHAVPDGSVPVLGPHGMADGLALDPFDAERLYPRAHRTEPGDVVFADGSPPRALVDTRGGALVASPSRILRLRPGAGVGPHTLAAIINHQVCMGEWQTWSVPLLDAAAEASLEVALAQADTYGVALRRRQDALHDLITALIEGVGAGDVSVVPSSDNQEGP